MWKEIKRVLKPRGLAVFTTAQPFTSQFVLSNTDWYKYEIIWKKTIGSGQLNIRYQPLKIHENILVFYDKAGTYNEQRTKGRPYKITRKANSFKGSYGKQKDHTSINNGFRRAQSVLEFSNPRIKDGQPTEKPVALMEYLIKSYSNEGDTVLDFAMGHGTTGVGCVLNNRKFIGIEKSKEWYIKAGRRIEQYFKRNKINT